MIGEVRSNFFLRAKYRIRCLLSKHPGLFFAVYGCIPKHRRVLVNKKTKIVIEGYPRSGNTFALWAFTHNNPNIGIAHHTHSQAQVIRALEANIPTLIVIREPTEAIRSFIVRYPYITPDMAIAGYMDFYRTVEKYLTNLVLATFEEVTTDFGLVEQRINKKYGTNFNILEHNEVTTKSIFKNIDEANRSAYGELLISHLPRPHDSRNILKKGISLKSIEPSLSKASELHNHLISQRQS